MLMRCPREAAKGLQDRLWALRNPKVTVTVLAAGPGVSVPIRTCHFTSVG
jgi:protein involved in polysaccharide export with SLBB domain